MKFFLKLTLIALLSTPLLLVAIVYLSIEKKPLIQTEKSQLSHRDITKAKNLLRQHDPRGLKNGQAKSFSLNSKELNLVGNYLLNRLNGRLNITLNDKAAYLKLTFQLPPKKQDYFINLSIFATQENSATTIRKFQIGSLNLPPWLSNLLFNQLIQIAHTTESARPFINALQAFEFNNRLLMVRYLWNPELLNIARNQLISKKEQELLYRYQEQLIKAANQPSLGRRISLDHYITALFSYAKEQSKNSDPIAENRAALIVLGQHLGGRGHQLLFPKTAHLHPRRKEIRLNGRHDLAQHFMISATLSAMGNSQLADLIGLQKELEDSRGGSGFSFTDLMADRAGNYFGKAATESEESARRLQNFISFQTKEVDYMPSIKGLPEGLSSQAFKQQFGSSNSQRFRKIEAVIEQRINKTSLHQAM